MSPALWTLNLVISLTLFSVFFSLELRSVLLVCWLVLTLCFGAGHAWRDAHSCCPRPALPLSSLMATVAALKMIKKKENSLSETQSGICSTTEAAVNILAELSSLRLGSPWRPPRGQMFPNNLNPSHNDRGERCLFYVSAFAEPWRSEPACLIFLLIVLTRGEKKSPITPPGSFIICGHWNICSEVNKKSNIKHGSWLNLVPGFILQLSPSLWNPISDKVVNATGQEDVFCII